MALHLLVVEDEIPIREIVRAILEEEGYRVVAVGDGRAALAALAADRYHLVLSDMMMPHLDGLGLAQAMQAEPNFRAIPLILMSAVKPARTQQVPHAAFIAKPFDLNDLLNTVERALAS
jgi:CheY-like chemotaxis protein